MSWLFPKRTPKAAEPRRTRLGVEPLECRTMPATDLLSATTATPETTDATVRTLDSTSAQAMSMDAAIDQFAKFSPDQLKQLDKGLQSVEMIAHLSDLFGMMADHLQAGERLGFDLGVGQGTTSLSATVSGLLAQLQRSMDGTDFSDFLTQLNGPTSAQPDLPGLFNDQMRQAEENMRKAFETVGNALAALGIYNVQVIMTGGSDGAGAWGAFVPVPGASDGWSFLLSIPGLQQQDVNSLLEQWQSGLDPRTASDVSDAINDWAGCVADWSVTTVAIGGTLGGAIGSVIPGLGTASGAAGGTFLGVTAAVGWCTGVTLAKWEETHPIPLDGTVVPASDSGGTSTSDPKKTNPVPDGPGPDEYDRYWGWFNPIDINPATGVTDPPDEIEEATFDMARFVRLVVAAAVSKVNPNPEGGSTGGSGDSGGTVTGGFGGILGGDPADDQPIIYTDTSPGGNPIIMFLPPRNPIGR